MARPSRFQYPGAIYHVMARGDNPLSPLSDPFKGALKRPTQKANSLALAKALRDGDGAC
jgi:hypothetical protein